MIHRPALRPTTILCLAVLLGAAPAHESRAADAAQPTERQLENIIAFTRLSGYVRHFHPSEEAFDTNWWEFLARGMATSVGARIPSELADALESLFAPIAPTLRVFPDDNPEAAPGVRALPGSPITFVIGWEHQGFSLTNQPSMFHSRRRLVPITDGAAQSKLADPSRAETLTLGGGVSCSLYLALYVDQDNRTLPPASALERPGPDPASLPREEIARAARLAQISVVWNCVQHFSPILEESEDWRAALEDGVRAAWPDGADLRLAILRMLAHLPDSQAAVRPLREGLLAAAPIALLETDAGFTVLACDAASLGPTPPLPGERLLSIDGVPVDDAIEEASPFVPAATDATRRALAHQN